MAAQERLFLEVCINGRCFEPSLVLRDSDGQHAWLVDVELVEALGLSTGRLRPESSEGREYVNLSSAFEETSYAFDSAAQALHVTLPGRAWPERRLSRVPTRPYQAPVAMHSAYASYSLHLDDDLRARAFGEAGAVYGAWLLRNSFSVSPGTGWSRRATSLELDQPLQQRRWILGDQDAAVLDPFGSGVSVAGLGVRRVFDLTPGFVSFPGADVRGVLQAPGSVDVYSNGVLVAHQDLQPGPFSLRDLVLPRGHNNLRVLVNDPFSGSYELTDSFYGSNRLLRAGLHEFDDRIGFVTRFRGSQSPDYGPLMLSMTHRYGVSDGLTLGARLEVLDGRRNAGATLDLSPGAGVLTLAAARTWGEGTSGSAWRGGYSFQTRHFGIAAGMGRNSQDYRAITDDIDAPGRWRMREERYASISSRLWPRASATARFQARCFEDGSCTRIVGLDLSWRLYRRLDALFQVSRTRGSLATGHEAMLRLQLALPQDSISIGTSHQRGKTAFQVAAQRSPPTDRGWGYRVELTQRDHYSTASAGLDWVSAAGRTHLRVASIGGGTSADLYHSGGLLWVPGEGLHVARGGGDAYALVATGIPGVVVMRENIPVALTDDQGRAWVSGLLPYQANLLSIDTDALDPSTRVQSDRVFVSVPRRGVTRADFSLRPLRAVQAFLVVSGTGGRRLRYGEASVGDHQVSAVGLEGQIYVEDLPAGSHDIRVLSGNTSYGCTLEVPAAVGVQWLGEVACVPKP